MKKKITLTSKILIGLLLGFVFGLILKQVPEGFIKNTVLLDGALKIIGNGFTSAIKMMVVPLVFVSLVCGTSSMGDVKRLGRIGGKTMLFYLGTTAIAIIISLVLGSTLKPGVGLDMSGIVSGEVARRIEIFSRYHFKYNTYKSNCFISKWGDVTSYIFCNASRNSYEYCR